jgi:hypothetical protein
MTKTRPESQRLPTSPLLHQLSCGASRPPAPFAPRRPPLRRPWSSARPRPAGVDPARRDAPVFRPATHAKKRQTSRRAVQNQPTIHPKNRAGLFIMSRSGLNCVLWFGSRLAAFPEQLPLNPNHSAEYRVMADFVRLLTLSEGIPHVHAALPICMTALRLFP